MEEKLIQQNVKHNHLLVTSLKERSYGGGRGGIRERTRNFWHSIKEKRRCF